MNRRTCHANGVIKENGGGVNVLIRPSSCLGCPLNAVAAGFMEPQIPFLGNGVMLLGEALGADEVDAGKPFVGKAGFRLTRLIEWGGFHRADFIIANAAWCRPPDNKLEGTSFESGAIAHCYDKHWRGLLPSARVIVPMGNVPTGFLLGKKGILSLRGYVYQREGQYVIPTVHPSFIQRGQSKWSAAFINDLQKAVELARVGMPPQFTNYLLDPSPLEALRWAQDYRNRLLADPRLYLAFDIETPGKPEDEDEADTDSDAPDRTWHIERIGFSYQGLAALSVPWAPEYMAAIRLLLSSVGAKVVWNAGFDVPRLRRAGVEIGGVIHDGMVAWHILHSDLPKRLGFVATFTCPWQPAWKHLSGAKPAFYNATDADVELRSMEVIEAELRKTGLWDVYQRDVLDLEPILVHMQERGMPVDGNIRYDRAKRLAEELVRVRREMETAVPESARRIEKVFARRPKNVEGLRVRPGTRRVNRCSVCGAERPGKAHFKRFVKKQNPCCDGTIETRDEAVEEYYRLAPFTPSRDQLIRYHQCLRRDLPMVFDKKERKKKVSFGERQLKDLTIRYKDDILYLLIILYRELDKLAGAYLGRVCGQAEGE
jgi:uracil-DNA glycosylase family 4